MIYLCSILQYIATIKYLNVEHLTRGVYREFMTCEMGSAKTFTEYKKKPC